MVKYHPDTRYLTEYAAGSLERSIALCVSVHLHYCPPCRAKVRDLCSLGAELFTRLEPLAPAAEAFARVERSLDALPPTRLRRADPAQEVEPRAPAVPILPAAIHKLTQGDLNKLKWNSLGKSFRYFRIPAGDSRLTQLLHIRAGGRVPRHRHIGEEITVVLEGSFSDREDHYHQGDFIVRSSGEQHRPVASQHEDCLCLATLDAPNTMTNWLYRLLEPLRNLRIA